MEGVILIFLSTQQPFYYPFFLQIHTVLFNHRSPTLFKCVLPLSSPSLSLRFHRVSGHFSPGRLLLLKEIKKVPFPPLLSTFPFSL